MGFLSNLIRKKSSREIDQFTIPECEKEYYREDSYYTEQKPILAAGSDGQYGTTKVITFDERKKISYPSKSGLYVAEILLLEYCTYGTYPRPKNGYPGFWWFEYGIRDVGMMLDFLMERGYIQYCSAAETLPSLTIPQLKEIANSLGITVSGKKADIVSIILDAVTEENLAPVVPERKFKLTDKGVSELSENAYVPYMHKEKNKTVETNLFGPQFNVWEVNRRLKGNVNNWEYVIADIKREQADFARKKQQERVHVTLDEEDIEPRNSLTNQDKQLEKIKKAEDAFNETGDIGALIEFWETIWENGGLLFNGSRWTFRLPDLYIKEKRYDDALKVLKKIKNPAYKEKVISYREKILKAKERYSTKKG